MALDLMRTKKIEVWGVCCVNTGELITWRNDREEARQASFEIEVASDLDHRVLALTMLVGHGLEVSGNE
jgi:hypothetical protein